jgi:hypothetical protein
MKIAKYVLAAALIALVTPSAVRAETIVFDASGTFSDGSILTGTLTTDTTTGLVTAASLSTTGTKALGPFTLVLIQHPVKGNASLETVGIFDSSINDGLSLVFPTLTSYTGGSLSLCGSAFAHCPLPTGFILSDLGIDFNTTNAVFPLIEGMLTPVPTPEPSCLLLFGVGLSGLVTMTLFRKQLA